MSFLYGWFLWLLLPWIVYLWRVKERQKLQQKLRWIALGLLIVAMARPVEEKAPIKQTTPAHAIVIALDLSASMRAEDIAPNRQKASRTTIKVFLERNLNDQIALIGFTINPLLLSPPTTDHSLVATALESLRSDYILTKGTDLKKLFKKVAKFPDDKKIVLLFSDGGDEPIDEELITFVKESNIEILAIAMATKYGASVKSNKGELLKDREGHIVVSRLNPGLSKLAKESGGELLFFESPQSTAHQIQSWIERQKAAIDGISRQIHTYGELYAIPTLLALLLLFLSGTRFLHKVVVLLALIGVNLQAKELVQKESWGNYYHTNKNQKTTKNLGLFDSYYLNRAYINYRHKAYRDALESILKIEENTLESQLLLAHTYYKLERYKKAKSILKSIKSTNPKIKQQLLYELGNCEAKLSYFQRAKSYYIKALELKEDDDTLHNLGVVIAKEKESSKMGFTNPNSAEASNTPNSSVAQEDSPTANKEESSGGSGGGSGTQSTKNSTIKVITSDVHNSSKRVLSSKAYDLINEGYIKEVKPW